MIVLDLVQVIDHGKVVYQALTNDEFDNLVTLESDYSHLADKYHFTVIMLGEVQIPSIGD